MRSATASRWEAVSSSGVSMRQGAPIASNSQTDAVVLRRVRLP